MNVMASACCRVERIGDGDLAASLAAARPSRHAMGEPGVGSGDWG